MSRYNKAINQLIRLKGTLVNINFQIPPALKGSLGELYVLEKLHDLGYKRLKPKGGQAGFDIYIQDIDKKLEVKTSLLKNERIYDNNINFWGWTVKKRNQKREIKFDILVCVTLDNEYKNPHFYIFTRDEALMLKKVKIGRFKNIEKKIHLFENINSYRKAIRVKPRLVTEFERYINNHRAEFRNKWYKIKISK